MSGVVLHAKSKALIAEMHNGLPQALLLYGEKGVGVESVAVELFAPSELIVRLAPKLQTKTSSIPRIGVEDVRELFSLTKGKREQPGVVFIESIDAMTIQAQNAFLKLLEEPPASTHFILTANAIDPLLPTIRSRVMMSRILPIGGNESQAYLDELGVQDATKRAQLLFMAEGLPVELSRLAADERYFAEQVQYVQTAKTLLGEGAYHAVATIIANKYARDEALELLRHMIRILTRTASHQATLRLKGLLAAENAIRKGGSVKLHLASAVV